MYFITIVLLYNFNTIYALAKFACALIELAYINGTC